MLSDLHVGAVFTNINRLQLYIDLNRSYLTFYARLSLVSLLLIQSVKLDNLLSLTLCC